MKPSHTAALCLTAFLAGSTLSATGPAPAGRYQITAGPYHTVNPDGHVTSNAGVFRVDTATGEIEEIVQSVEGGRLRRDVRPFIGAR